MGRRRGMRGWLVAVATVFGSVLPTVSVFAEEGTELAVFDVYRVQDGHIVEHWDNAEPIPDGPQPNRGKF